MDLGEGAETAFDVDDEKHREVILGKSSCEAFEILDVVRVGGEERREEK